MNLQHHLLIATPIITDPIFGQSVIYICEHSKKGAMGLIINKPIEELNLDILLDRLEIGIPFSSRANLANTPVLNGGPLSDERGFVLHTPCDHYSSSIQITDDVMVTTSKDILTSLSHERQPDNLLITLGYAGWEQDQLEQEIYDNAWLTVEADYEILYETPPHLRRQKAARKLGFDINMMSNIVGHA